MEKKSTCWPQFQDKNHKLFNVMKIIKMLKNTTDKIDQCRGNLKLIFLKLLKCKIEHHMLE